MKAFARISLLFPLLLLNAAPAAAQLWKQLLEVAYDTAFVSAHDDDLTIRPCFGSNFKQYVLMDHKHSRKLIYQPNAPWTAGVGFSYRIIGITATFAVPWLNDHSPYGKSRFTDLTTNFYLHKWMVDVYWQRYQGQHLARTASLLTNWNPRNSLERPNMLTTISGVGLQYLISPGRFSMVGPFAQVQYQKRNAGSWIVGINVSRFYARDDSALLPPGLVEADYFGGSRFNSSLVLAATASLGYAYTFVVRKHLFLTGALTLGAGVNNTLLYTAQLDRQDRDWSPQVNAMVRLAAGYNSERYFAGIQYVDFSSICYSPIKGGKQQFDVGHYNVTVARRFQLRKRLFGFY